MIRDRDIALLKPKALRPGATLALVSPASPGEEAKLQAGIAELQRLGFRPIPPNPRQPSGYFSGTNEERMKEFVKALENKEVNGLIATRGGFGSSHLFDRHFNSHLAHQRCVIGFSDLTAIQVFIWQLRHWVTFYGQMVAAGLAAGPGNPSGYDQASFLQSLQTTSGGWEIPLAGETMIPGDVKGRVLGGCLTLLQNTIGTGWELDTRESILVLEDRGMKPYQVDRALLHLLQAGKFQEVHGVVLGDFPDCETPKAGGPSVRDVCEEFFQHLRIPVIFGAPVGHSTRAMLTVPLGIKAHLHAKGAGLLEILEPAVVG